MVHTKWDYRDVYRAAHDEVVCKELLLARISVTAIPGTVWTYLRVGDVVELTLKEMPYGILSSIMCDGLVYVYIFCSHYFIYIHSIL